MNRNDSPWANPALALALLRPQNAAPKPQQPPPCDTPSCQQAVNKERETEKGKSPCTPFKEKDKGKEIPPPPSPPAPARTHAQAPGETERKGEGKVGFRPDSWKGEGKAFPSFALPSGIDHDYIMDPRRDPVEMALFVLNIPRVCEYKGRVYNNPRLMRKVIRQIGEEVFREIVYTQFSENDKDNEPLSYGAVFFAKLYACRDAMRGGEGTPTACKKASANAAARLRTESREARRSVSGASLPCIGVDETRGGVA